MSSNNSSSQQIVTQKGGVKMGPREYNEIKSKMGKILQDPEEDQNEGERKISFFKGPEKAKLEINDPGAFEQFRQFTPSSNTMSLDSLSTKNQFQFNGHIFNSPGDTLNINSLQNFSKNTSPRYHQEGSQKPKTVQTQRKRHFSQADPYQGTIHEEDENMAKNRQLPKTSGGIQNGIKSSLLSSKSDIQYIQHLRKAQNKPSFHDHINQLDYDSHINDQYDKKELFSNRNVVINTVDNIDKAIIPKKFDHFHVTEGIVPGLLDSTKENADQKQPQNINNKLKNNSSYTAQINKINQLNNGHLTHRSSNANSVASSPKYMMTSTFTQSMADRVNNPLSAQNNQATTQTSFFNRPSTQGTSKVGFKFIELKSQDKSYNQCTTKNVVSQLLSNKAKSSSDFKQLSRQNSFDLTSKLEQVNKKPKQVSIEQKNKITKRQEVLNVKKWMDERLEELVKNDNLNINQIFTYFQNIFQASLSEILRQIGTECKERGELLQEIWDSQVSMSEKIFINITKETNKIEKNSLEEINRLHKHYQTELNRYFKMVDDRDALILDLKTQLNSTVSENRLFRKKGQKVEKNYKIINNQINQLQEEYNMLFQENLALLMNSKQIDWQTAIKQKKKMLEEIQMNRKMRNNLLKVGESVKRERLTLEEQMKKNEIDDLVRQFVIDRETNMPVQQGKKDEEEEEEENYEVDQNKQVILKEFWKTQETDTSDLFTVKVAETNTEIITRAENQTQTRRTKQIEIGIQKDNEDKEYVDQILQTEIMNYNSYCQTDVVETLDIMIQCSLLEPSQTSFERLSAGEIQGENSKSKQKSSLLDKKKKSQKQGKQKKSNSKQSQNQLENNKNLSIIFTDSANDSDALRSDQVLKQKTLEKGKTKENILQIIDIKDGNQEEREQKVDQNSNNQLKVTRTQVRKSSYSNQRKSQVKQKSKEKNDLAQEQNYFITGLDQIDQKEQSSSSQSEDDDDDENSLYEQSQTSQNKSPNTNTNTSKQSKQKAQPEKFERKKNQKMTMFTKDLEIDEKQIKEVKQLLSNQQNLQNVINFQKVQSFIDQSISKHEKLQNQHNKDKLQIQKYENILKEKEEQFKKSKDYYNKLISKYDKKSKDANKTGRQSKQISMEDDNQSEISVFSDRQGNSGKNSIFKQQSKQQISNEQKRKSYTQQKFTSYIQNASEQERSSERSPRSSRRQSSIMLHISPQNQTQKKSSYFGNSGKESSSYIQTESQISAQNIHYHRSEQDGVISEDGVSNKDYDPNDSMNSNLRYTQTEQAINSNDSQSFIVKRNLQIQRLNLDFSQENSNNNNRRKSLLSSEPTPLSGRNLQPYSMYGQPLKSPYQPPSRKSSGNRSSFNVNESPRLSAYQSSPLINSRGFNKTHSINTDPAIAIKKKFESYMNNIKVPKNSLKFIPLILKMMNSIITDNFKSLKNNEQILNPLFVQVYEYFLYQFGLRKVAELKMLSVMEQCILMQNEYKQIKIFMNIYFNDYKSIELHFFCKMYLNLSENTQQVKVEKSTTNKYKILTTLPIAFKDLTYQRETLDHIIKLEKNTYQESQQEIKDSNNIDILQINSLSNDMINEFNQVKFEMFEVIQFFLGTFLKYQELLISEYSSVLYAILSNLENTRIDEEGIKFLSVITNLSEQQSNEFLGEFVKKSVMNEMNYDQFILLASEFNVFKTQQILDLYPDKNKTLSEIKEYWSENKAQCEEQVMTGQYYNIYTKNVFEKLDILSQLLETDQEDPNNQNYLETHKLSFVICYIIISKICS